MRKFTFIILKIFLTILTLDSITIMAEDSYYRPKVLITHPGTPQSAINILKLKCDVTICEGLPTPTRYEILSKSKGMDGILWATHEKLDAEALDAAGPQLKAISAKSAGIDYIDVAEVKRRGIALGHTPGVLNDAVADIAIGLMIAAARRFHEGRLKIELNQWESANPNWMLGQDIVGSTVGIIGLGGIGQTIAKRLSGFDVSRILYCGHSRKQEAEMEYKAKFVTLNELLVVSDFVFISCPLTNETAGMINADTLKLMKPTSILINVARGGIVVQSDLVDALKSGQIFAAGLDVMNPEPLPSDDPIMKLPNVVIIPHLGSATKNTEDNMACLAARNVLSGLMGEQMMAQVV